MTRSAVLASLEAERRRPSEERVARTISPIVVPTTPPERGRGLTGRIPAGVTADSVRRQRWSGKSFTEAEKGLIG